MVLIYTEHLVLFRFDYISAYTNNCCFRIEVT